MNTAQPSLVQLTSCRAAHVEQSYARCVPTRSRGHRWRACRRGTAVVVGYKLSWPEVPGVRSSAQVHKKAPEGNRVSEREAPGWYNTAADAAHPARPPSAFTWTLLTSAGLCPHARATPCHLCRCSTKANGTDASTPSTTAPTRPTGRAGGSGAAVMSLALERRRSAQEPLAGRQHVARLSAHHRVTGGPRPHAADR